MPEVPASIIARVELSLSQANLTIVSLLQFGSSLDEVRFDRRGNLESDYDILAIVNSLPSRANLEGFRRMGAWDQARLYKLSANKYWDIGRGVDLLVVSRFMAEQILTHPNYPKDAFTEALKNGRPITL